MKQARSLDPHRYRRLIAKVSPVIIETEQENERVLTIIERLMAKAEKRSAEEDAILNLLVHLVEQFEEKSYPIGEAAPADIWLLSFSNSAGSSRPR